MLTLSALERFEPSKLRWYRYWIGTVTQPRRSFWGDRADKRIAPDDELALVDVETGR